MQEISTRCLVAFAVARSRVIGAFLLAFFLRTASQMTGRQLGILNSRNASVYDRQIQRAH